MPAQTSVPIRLPGSFPSNVPHPSGYNASPLPPPTDYYVSRKELLEVAPDLGVMKSVPSATADTVVLFDDKGQVKSSGIKLSDKADTETVKTLVGEDKGKSARDIAKEEVNQLLGDNPDEFYNTFEEVAGFIDEAKENYQAINNALSETAKTLTDVKATADSTANEVTSVAEELTTKASSATVQELQTKVETEYAKKSNVVKLHSTDEGTFAQNDLGDLGATLPRELFDFTATVDAVDEEGNVVRLNDQVHGAVGADGFMVRCDWGDLEGTSTGQGTYSHLGAGSLDIYQKSFDENYPNKIKESFSVCKGETTGGGFGIVVRTMDEEGDGTFCAAAMTSAALYVDYIYGGLTDYNDLGHNGVAHIEFSPMADIGYRHDYGTQQEYYSADIESIVQTARDYSSGGLNNLQYMSFYPGSMNEIMFYMGNSDYDSRTIRLDDVYTAVYENNYGSIQFGDNYYDAHTDYGADAFSLVDTFDYQTHTSFGAFGVSVHGGYGGPYDHAEFGNYVTQMRGMTSDGFENYVVMYNSGIETNGYLQATDGDIYYTSIYPRGVDTTGYICVTDGSRTYAYLSQSGLSIYGDVGYMIISPSTISMWDNENLTELSLDEFRAVKQMVNVLNKTTIDHFEGINVSDMTQEQKSEILNFFVTEYFNAKKSLKGMG